MESKHSFNTTRTQYVYYVRQSIQLCEQIQLCIEQEREALIGLKMDRVAELVAEKQFLSSELKKMRNLAQKKKKELLTVPTQTDQVELDDLQKEWNRNWEKLVFKIEANNKFLKHSLKNLGQLIDNLKRAMGDSISYSNEGKAKENQTQGRYLHKSY